MKVGIKLGKVKKFGIGWCIPHRVVADNAKGGFVRPPPAWNRVFDGSLKFHYFIDFWHLIILERLHIILFQFSIDVKLFFLSILVLLIIIAALLEFYFYICSNYLFFQKLEPNQNLQDFPQSFLLCICSFSLWTF